MFGSEPNSTGGLRYLHSVICSRHGTFEGLSECPLCAKDSVKPFSIEDRINRLEEKINEILRKIDGMVK